PGTDAVPEALPEAARPSRRRQPSQHPPRRQIAQGAYPARHAVVINVGASTRLERLTALVIPSISPLTASACFRRILTTDRRVRSVLRTSEWDKGRRHYRVPATSCQAHHGARRVSARAYGSGRSGAVTTVTERGATTRYVLDVPGPGRRG